MIPVSCGEIADAVNGELAGVAPSDVVDGAVVIDSRAAGPGGLFVALPGENVDGHDYVGTATAAGVTASLTARPVEGSPCIVVADPQAALGALARLVVSRLPDLTVIALTGSSGKTSTKDLIGQLIRSYGETVVPEGSFNNEIGHPLTALQATERTKYLVAEMGARHQGDITYLAGITPPKIGLVLNVGTSHIGEFGSQDNIAVAKGEMIEAVTAGGTAVLNADDHRVAAMRSRTRERVLTFGEAPEADIRAEGVKLDAEGQPAFTLRIGDFSGDIQLQFIGEHYVSNALAAAAVGSAVGMTPEQLADGLNAATRVSAARMELTERRGRRHDHQRRLQRQPGLDPRRTEGTGRDRPLARGADLGGARRDARVGRRVGRRARRDRAAGGATRREPAARGRSGGETHSSRCLAGRLLGQRVGLRRQHPGSARAAAIRAARG